ncbi:MAG TPA: hypothetical protein VGO97_00195 [Solirubrobacterales bacterium]|jgi:hypothetical protein|nr:hypothetical protein [Solirubrobacterales bacterium]
MKMRQSLAEFERAFHEHTHVDRTRRHEVRQAAIRRTHVRRRERHVQSQFRRYVTLVTALLATVVLVTIAMFQTLSWLMS